jgi:uncharacterized membrane protein
MPKLPMATLIDLLQEVDPAVSSTQAANLRAGLAAISQEWQRNTISRQFSLNDWWRWLDDEGYSRESFLSALCLLGRDRMGASSWSLLNQAYGGIGDEPDGLNALLDQLDQLDPELPQHLHGLEVQAISEETEILQIAGGTAKRVAVNIALVGSIGGIYFYYKRNKKVAKEMLEHGKKTAEQKTVNEAANLDRSKEQLLRKGRQEFRFAERDTRQAAFDFKNAAYYHAQQTLQRVGNMNKRVFDNAKDIKNYTQRDVEDRVAKLVADHTLAYLVNSVEQKAVLEIKNGQVFKQKLLAATADVQKKAIPGVPINSKEASQRAEKALEKESWFTQEKTKILGSERYGKLWNGELAKLQTAYRELVDQEIRIAKQETKKAESRFLDARIRFVEDKIIHKSNVIINQDVVKLVEQAKGIEREAERAAERDSREAEWAAERDSSVVIEEL